MSVWNKFFEAANAVWRQYLECGPGQLTAEGLAPFLQARGLAEAEIVEDPELIDKVHELEKLLRRCVERPEGLCFVTGEAGLIPRQDLHQQCESLLAFFQQLSLERR